MIDVDERIFGTSPFCITQYIKEGYERRFIQKVALKNGFELYKTIEDVYNPILDEKRTIYCYCKRKQVEAN